MAMISVMVLVFSWERIVRLRIFPFWDGYCNYLFRRDVYKNKIFLSVFLHTVELQVVKKVILTKGKFKDYWNEIQQSYVLGFTPYRLYKNPDGTFVTPIRYYDGKVYVLDDVVTVEVGETDIFYKG